MRHVANVGISMVQGKPAEGTYKLLRAWKVKKLDEAEVVPCDHVEAGAGDGGTDHIGLFRVVGPNSQHVISLRAAESSQVRTPTKWDLSHTALIPKHSQTGQGELCSLHTVSCLWDLVHLPGPGGPRDFVCNRLI